MGLLDGIEKLINEHGSAAILRERIQLANDKYSDIERRMKVLEAENLGLKSEAVSLRTQLQSAKTKIDEIRRLQDQADEQRKQQIAGANALPADRATALRAVCFNPDRTADQISKITGLTVQIVEWHLDALRKARMVSIQITAGSDWTGEAGRTNFDIRPEGRAYLAEHGMLDAG